MQLAGIKAELREGGLPTHGSVEEFTAGIKALPGVNASDDAIRALISAIDIDESGAIDSQEFVAMVLRET